MILRNFTGTKSLKNYCHTSITSTSKKMKLVLWKYPVALIITGSPLDLWVIKKASVQNDMTVILTVKNEHIVNAQTWEPSQSSQISQSSSTSDHNLWNIGNSNAQLVDKVFLSLWSCSAATKNKKTKKLQIKKLQLQVIILKT